MSVMLRKRGFRRSYNKIQVWVSSRQFRIGHCSRRHFRAVLYRPPKRPRPARAEKMREKPSSRCLDDQSPKFGLSSDTSTPYLPCLTCIE